MLNHNNMRLYRIAVFAYPAVGGALSAPAIRSGDMVVFFEGREAIGFDRMKAKGIWQCRHGAFHHDEIVGKPFGSRVSLRLLR